MTQMLSHHAPGDQPAVAVTDVRKRFGTTEALRGVDLTVQQGTICGLLGPNGAGKTTIVNILSTLLTPDAGEARVAGFDVVRNADRVRASIGLTGQYAAVDELLSGRQNLEMVGRLYHLSPAQARQRATELLAQFSLTDAGGRLVREYSGGMRRRLDLAASLVARPHVLFLDEPTTGLDPRSRLEMWSTIRELVRSGTTLLLTTQYLDEADQLADDIAVIDTGRVVASGTPDALKASIGSDQIAVSLPLSKDVLPAIDLLQRITGNTPVSDRHARELSVTVSNGARALTDVVRAFDNAAIELANIALRQPTLDEVFLRLTGHAANPVSMNAVASGNAVMEVA
jgi:ABC-2 type transport system ATP-binding protein